MIAAHTHTLHRRLTAVITTAAALVAQAAANPHGSVGAENRCYGVQASGTTTFDPGKGGFTGTATFRLGGRSQEVEAAATTQAVAWP